MTYKDVIQGFNKKSDARALSDDYLQENHCETRENVPLAIEFHYGIVYLRDDAVEVLIQRIVELEAKLTKEGG